MAYFHCLIGGGSSGGGYELTVTCDADFAGTTITCTDGVTTLTQTCPSASPYEVVFEIPNGGDWTISGVVGGHTVSTGVNIPTSASLIATIQQTVTIHSAKEDTISFTDESGARTEVFASDESSKIISIEIQPNGQSITFTSSVAKNPNDLTEYYSKTVTVDENTTEIYLMPENVIYWYGWFNSLYGTPTAGAWNSQGGTTSNEGLATAPTINTNKNNLNVSLPSPNNGVGLVYFPTQLDLSDADSIKTIINTATIQSSQYSYQTISMRSIVLPQNQYAKNAEVIIVDLGGQTGTKTVQNTVKDLDVSGVSNGYVGIYIRAIGTVTIGAIWYE